MEYPYDDATLELQVRKTGKDTTSTRVVSTGNRVAMTIKLTSADWADLQSNSGMIAEIMAHNMPAGCVGRIHLRGLVADVDDRVFNAISTVVDVALDGKSAAYEPRPLDYSRKRCTPRADPPAKPTYIPPPTTIPDTTGDAEYAKLLQKMEDNLHYDYNHTRDSHRRTTSDIRSDLRKYSKTPGVSIDARPESFYSEIIDDGVADDYGWIDKDLFNDRTTHGEIDWRRECEIAWPDAELSSIGKSTRSSSTTTSKSAQSTSTTTSTQSTSTTTSTRTSATSASDCAFGYRSLSGENTIKSRTRDGKSRRRTENLKRLLPTLGPDWMLELPSAPELFTTYYHLNINDALKTAGMFMKLYPHQIPILRRGSTAIYEYVREIISHDLRGTHEAEFSDIIVWVADMLTSLPVSGWK